MGATRLQDIGTAQGGEAGIIDHWRIDNAYPEKYMNEVWQYANNAALLEHWSNVNGTITRTSDNYILMQTPATTGQIVDLTTINVLDFRVSPVSLYKQNVLSFKQTVRLLTTNADYFIGMSSVAPNGEVSSTAFFAALGHAIGFIAGNSGEAGNEIRGFVQISGVGSEIVNLGIPFTTAITQLGFTINPAGHVEFYVNGVLRGTSVDSPDRRPTGQMSVCDIVRADANAISSMHAYALSASTKFLNF